MKRNYLKLKSDTTIKPESGHVEITFQHLNYCILLRIAYEGSVPQMRVWSTLIIKSDLKWCIHLRRCLFFIFHLLGECHCWLTRESPRAHVAEFYGLLPLILSVLREYQNFPWFKLIEIVILWVYYTTTPPPLASACFCTFGASLCNIWLLCMAKDHWRGFSTRNEHMVHIVN